MDKQIITKLKQTFENYANEKEGIEFWFARDLQKLLEYDDWRNFLNVIEKAKIACKNSSYDVNDHFVDVTKTIPMPKSASKEIPENLPPEEDIKKLERRVKKNEKRVVNSSEYKKKLCAEIEDVKSERQTVETPQEGGG
ncbi:MAG: hypothetical protein HY363_01810 [Candidatus Aenigmarchaeota archaeon]|nr:hypothetical protein [Candidatus Aenigmarchaeota archaeon]